MGIWDLALSFVFCDQIKDVINSSEDHYYHTLEQGTNTFKKFLRKRKKTGPITGKYEPVQTQCLYSVTIQVKIIVLSDYFLFICFIIRSSLLFSWICNKSHAFSHNVEVICNDANRVSSVSTYWNHFWKSQLPYCSVNWKCINTALRYTLHWVLLQNFYVTSQIFIAMLYKIVIDI